MGISREEVESVARLAKLDLDDEEIEQYREELGAILEYVDKLEELDTEDVEPTTHALLSEMLGREDDLEQGLSRDEVLENAPDHSDGEFRVPRIVD